MALLTTILIVILVYYALRLGLKWLAPKLLSYAAKKTKERFEERFGQYGHTSQTQTPEGETIIKKKPRPKANPSKKVGEYIDFEEIE